MKKNSLQKGSIRYIVFKEDDVWYAVGLEFNIVESGDDPQEALFMLLESMRGYVASARKIKARPNILNQKTDPEYEALWKKINQKDAKQSYQPLVFAFGQAALSAA